MALVRGLSPAGAQVEGTALEVIVNLHAAGGDAVDVGSDASPSLLPDVVEALGLGERYRVADSRSTAQFDGRFATAEADGSLLYRLNTGRLQVLANEHRFDAVDLDVCVPRVRHRFEAIQSPATTYWGPDEVCKGWLVGVNEPPIDGRVRLFPDRERYGRMVFGVAGAAALVLVALVGGALGLRARPLRRRTWVSWLLAAGLVLVVPAVGWMITTWMLWFSGTPADALLISGGGAGRQVARTLLPGLVWIVPALVPAVLLLLAPRAPRRAAPAPVGSTAPAPPPYWQPPPPPAQSVYPPPPTSAALPPPQRPDDSYWAPPE